MHDLASLHHMSLSQNKSKVYWCVNQHLNRVITYINDHKSEIDLLIVTSSVRWLWCQRRQRICGTLTTCSKLATAWEHPPSGKHLSLSYKDDYCSQLSIQTQLSPCLPTLHRKVQTESTTGSVGSSRVRTTLTLCVEAIDFDSQACQLRVKGTNIVENQYVKVWDFYTT